MLRSVMLLASMGVVQARIAPEYESVHITFWPQTGEAIVADECMEAIPAVDTKLHAVPDYCCHGLHHDTMPLPRVIPFHPLKQCTTFEYDGGGPTFRGMAYLGCDGLVNGHRVPTYGEFCWPTWYIPPSENLTAVDEKYGDVTSPQQCGPHHCRYHAVGGGCYRINMLSDIGQYISDHPNPVYPEGLAEAYKKVPTAGFISLPDHCNKYSDSHLDSYVNHHEIADEFIPPLEGTIHEEL